MKRFRQDVARTTDGTDPSAMSRRHFLQRAGLAAGGLLLIGTSCGDTDQDVRTTDSRMTSTDPPLEQPPDTQVPPTIDGQVDTSTTAEAPVTPPTAPDTNAPETSTAPMESYINEAEVMTGQKVFDLVVTQPGESTPMMNIPAFAWLLETGLNNPILDSRGVTVEVAKMSRNADNINPDGGLRRSEQALPGEVGAVMVFGHRVTDVAFDRDGDGQSDNPENKEVVFEHLDQVLPGAILELQMPDGRTLRYRALVYEDGIVHEDAPDDPPPHDGTRAFKVIRNIEVDGKTNKDNAQKYRNQDTGGRKLLRTTACHKPGSARDRIIVEWEQIEE